MAEPPRCQLPSSCCSLLGYGLGLRASSRSDLCRKIFLLLFDTFTELEADEALQLDTCPSVLRGECNDLGNRGLVIHYEKLRGKRVLLAELGQTTLDHLFDDVLRLAAFLRFFRSNPALALD